jgi:hypothetical protein
MGGFLTDWFYFLLATFIGIWVGISIGVRLESRGWRQRGDHPFMNRMESGGRLYQVKREE